MSGVVQGIIPIDKPRGKTAFWLVAMLRRHLKVRKIGHAGTLDPFATGVMLLLVGKTYTRLSNQFLCQDKEYVARVHLGISTDTYDCEGEVTAESSLIPSLRQVEEVLSLFQGEIDQVPPMFSAKKIQGKKLYELAREGKTVHREPVKVRMETFLLDYAYPYLDIRVVCSKGTYIRSIAHELGEKLGCGGSLITLQRTRSGNFFLKDCFDGSLLHVPTFDPLALTPWIRL
jgi:tRNA pseudouridine55 synthase